MVRVLGRGPRRLASVRNDRARFTKWVSPILGVEPMAMVPRRKIEEVVQALDRGVRAGALQIGYALHRDADVEGR